jgi:hypothetical protein
MPHQSNAAKGAVNVKKLAAGLLVAAIAGSAAVAQELQTLKERLSDKASDMQRVDNCGVPVERRGTMPRPDCPKELRRPEPSVEARAPAAPRTR